MTSSTTPSSYVRMLMGVGTTHFALAAKPGDTTAVADELRDRTEIVDALFRFALGQDRKDEGLFASAFTADAQLDFPASARWGGKPPLMSGRDPSSAPSWPCSRAG
ncbi:nuclear transport factor 2 family protein [Streptomyces sp. NPDC001480]|uniref:nuclear transport factor 2 family protein n=1 Tax=Streptomyces sp. NPDC001480 TaxID=3364577 RepID=UPI003679DC8B